MAINQALIDRFETEVSVDWFEVLVIHHSQFTPTTTHYMHNGINTEVVRSPIDLTTYDFQPIPFQVSLPTRDGEGRGDLTINFSFPQTLVAEQLEQALANPLEAISVKYSALLYAVPTVPMYDPYFSFYMTEVSANEESVTATCRISDLVNRSFPNGIYRGANFPGLIRR